MINEVEEREGRGGEEGVEGRVLQETMEEGKDEIMKECDDEEEEKSRRRERR